MQRKTGEETIPTYTYFCDTCGKKLGSYETCVEEDYFLEVGIGEIRSSKRELNFCNVECMTKYKRWNPKTSVLDGFLYVTIPVREANKFYEKISKKD